VSIEATYESRCPYCDEKIEEGDQIEQHEGEWLHVNCAEEAGRE
jgi:hypothetical protein